MDTLGDISRKKYSLVGCPDINIFCKKVKEITSDEVQNNHLLESCKGNLKNIEFGLKIIITIPAYNEERIIGTVIKGIKDVMDRTKYCYNYLILVVNDGSGDDTVKAAIKAGAFVYSHLENKGLAETFRTEMKVCCELGAEIIVHTDADGQYKAEEIPLLIEQIENGYDLVLGSRFKGTIENMSGMKKFGNKAFSLALSLLIRRKITDGQTGFRAFTRKVAEDIKIISDHTYTQEQIIKAAQLDFSMIEIPVYFAKRNNGTSRLMKSPIDYAIKAWKNIFRIYFR